MHTQNQLSPLCLLNELNYAWEAYCSDQLKSETIIWYYSQFLPRSYSPQWTLRWHRLMSVEEGGPWTPEAINVVTFLYLHSASLSSIIVWVWGTWLRHQKRSWSPQWTLRWLVASPDVCSGGRPLDTSGHPAQWREGPVRSYITLLPGPLYSV